MCNSDHEHDKDILEHLIHDAPVSNPHAAQSAVSSFQRATGQGVVAQRIDGLHDAKPILQGNPGELSGRAPPNPDRVTHA